MIRKNKAITRLLITGEKWVSYFLPTIYLALKTAKTVNMLIKMMGVVNFFYMVW